MMDLTWMALDDLLYKSNRYNAFHKLGRFSAEISDGKSTPFPAWNHNTKLALTEKNVPISFALKVKK